MNTVFTLQRVTQPSVEPVTLAQLIQHMREFSSVPQAAQDELTSLATSAREWVEDYTGRCLVDQQWRLTLKGWRGSLAAGDTVRGFPGPGPVNYGFYQGNYGFYQGLWNWGRLYEIPLRKSPVIVITSFVTVDAAGIETAVDPTTYEVREANSKWPRIVALNGATWSTWMTGDLRITFRAGFAAGLGSPDPTPDITLVPRRFVQAIMLYAESFYDRDEKTMQLYIDAATALIRPERSELSLA